MSPVRFHQITADEAGQRLDNFLLARLKGAPRSLVYKIVRKGQVRVNGGRVRPKYRLQAGDRVRIPPLSLPSSAGSSATPQRARQLEKAIIFEDDDLLAVDKPSGMAVHGGSGISAGVIENLRARRSSEHRLELVHRLDRATSGCLLLAKSRSALRKLHEQMRAGSLEKRYLLLVAGRWELGHKQINVPLEVHNRRGGERMVVVAASGKSASTWFRPLEFYREATLLEATLETGRTHQIRVHAAWAGHPLAGDRRYGDPAFNAAFAKHGLRRLFLHASALGFTHPRTGEPVLLSAPLPTELSDFLERLEKQGGRKVR